jgi:hypothetical protein
MKTMFLSTIVWITLFAPLTISLAETYVWDDISVPLKQTFRFSTAESAIVHITMPAEVLTQPDRIHFFFRIDEYKPSLRPYLMVNGNRDAFYYLGGNGMVKIRSDHLKAGKNELRFGDQTSTGDAIFVHEIRYQAP